MGGSKEPIRAEDFLDWVKVQSNAIYRGCEDPVAFEAAVIANIKTRIQFLKSALD